MTNPHDFRPYFEPGDETQRRAVALFPTNDVLILTGAAGSGKTHVAMALALNAVADRRASTIVLVRPTIECGDSLGYIPGTLDEKLAPWSGPIRDVMGNQSFAAFERLPIQTLSLQHMRGRTIANAVAVLDEAQNCTRGQLRMFLTRLGRNGKLILAGDPSQRDTEDDSLLWTIERLRGLSGVATVRLRGQHRHGLVSQMDGRLQ